MTLEAKEMIKVLLAPEPGDRPCASDIIKFPFMQGFTPKGLPLSCLSTKPVFATTPEAKVCYLCSFLVRQCFCRSYVRLQIK